MYLFPTNFRKVYLKIVFTFVRITMIFTKVFMCLLLCMWSGGQAVLSENGTQGNEIDGQTLFNFGRKYDKPLLSVIGRALINLHSCAQWSLWSRCETTRAGYFSVRKRTRSCGKIDETSQKLVSRIDEDFSFCEGRCPYFYNMTADGFCLKLYLETKNHDDAETQCETDGGYLVNIDSDQKYKAVKGVLTGYGNNVNIGGRRKDSSSPWEYKYGSQKGFFSWYYRHPRNELCLGLSDLLFFDHECRTASSFICEIPQ